ncbi:MAG: imidazolonepropionase [Armatimonadota bacterium]
MADNRMDLIITGGTILTCHSSKGYKTGKQMQDVNLLKDSFIAVKDGRIVDIDKLSVLNKKNKKAEKVIDFKDKVILPGFVDSHTHPVFGGSRVAEFQARAHGVTYEEIHAKGGGIQSTVNNTRGVSADLLYKRAKLFIEIMLRHGTTTVEVKSGYGLSSESEIKTLKVIKKLKKTLPVDIVSTFLGAHSVPKEYKQDRKKYIDIVINEMMPLVKKENLAEFIDVFCEEGAFTLEESRRILEKAKRLGFKLKIHADEFKNLGGSSLIASLKGTSSDHLMNIGDKDIKLMAENKTAGVILPGTTFFLGKDKYAPARKLIDSGVITALATDFNAGSCQTLSLQMIASLGCLKMKITSEEAINSITINGAYAAGVSNMAGSIARGKQADFCVLGIPDYREMPYYFGTNLVECVIKKGKPIYKPR